MKQTKPTKQTRGRRNLTRFAILLLLTVSLASGATAQVLRGQIVGVVTDSSGAALPGVLVTATGPELIQPLTATTNAEGAYRFPSLAPGSYAVTFQLAQFQTVRREGIQLSLRAVLRVDASLSPSTMTEEVNVVADASVIDVQSTMSGTSLSKELLTTIPNGRDLWSAMALAPGFSMGGVDVGGSHVGSQTRFTSYGSLYGSRTLIEGIISNNSRTSNSGYFDYGSLQEIEVSASGAMGEAAGPGSLLNFTVKSGSEAFHGGLVAHYQNDGLRSGNTPAALSQPGQKDKDGFFAPPAGIGDSNRTKNMYDVNMDLGGPLVREKALFYASVRDTKYNTYVPGLPGVTAVSRLSNATAKINYLLNPRNTLIGFYTWRYKLDSDRDISAAVPRESARNQVGKMHLAKLEWTSVLSDNLFLDLQAAYHYATNVYTPPTTKSQDLAGLPPAREDLVTGQFSGTSASLTASSDKRPQLTGSLDWSHGSHSIKVGFQFHEFTAGAAPYMAGDIVYYDRNGVPAELEVFNTPLDARDTNRNLGVYVQDSWNLGRRLTVNFGARYDNYVLGWPGSNFTPNQSAFFQAAETPATTVATLNSIGPRFGLSWDLAGDGKSVVKAFAGRFYLDPNTAVGEGANPVGVAGRRFVFTDANGNKTLDPGELGGQLSTSGGAGGVAVDPNYKLPYGDELSVHIEREFLSQGSVRVSFVKKTLRDLDDLVDIGRVGAYQTPFSFADVGPDNVRGTADDQTLSLLDRLPSAASNRVWTNPGSAVGTPENNSDFKTLEVAIKRRFQGRWMLLASFGKTWSNEFVQETARTGVQDYAYHNPRFRWEPNQRRFGRTNSSNWDAKLVGRYTIPSLGLAASSTLRMLSGYNWARTVSVRLPVAGSVTIPTTPTSANRAPQVNILDARLEKSLDLGSGKKATLVLDAFNLANSGTVTNFRVGSGSRFKEIIALLPPRTIRFGAEFRF